MEGAGTNGNGTLGNAGAEEVVAGGVWGIGSHAGFVNRVTWG